MFKKSGGGAITGTITGVEFESKQWESEKKGGDDYTTLSVKLLITPDGVDVPAERFIPAGFLHDGETISDDGQELLVEGDDDATVIQENTEFARFITSAIDKGFPADRFPENGRTFAALVGTRLVIKNEVDKEATAKFGKRKGKGKHKGKEFDRTYLIVDKILELPTEGGKKASKSASKPAAAAAKSAPKAGATKPPSKPAVEVEDDDITEQAKVALLTMLGNAKGNSIPKGQLSSALIKYALGANIEGSQREAIRAVLTGDDFLGLEDGWSVDGKNIVLAA